VSNGCSARTKEFMNVHEKQASDLSFSTTLAEKLVRAATLAGADAADAAVGTGSSLSARARDGEIEDVTRSSSKGSGLRVIVDGKLGFATAAAAPSTDDEIRTFAETAVALARVSTTSPHNVVLEATAPSGAELTRLVADLGLWDDATAEASAEWASSMALEAERIVRTVDGIAGVRDAGASARRGTFALATSTGFVGGYGGTSASMWVSALTDDGDKKQVDGWWSAARKLEDLATPESVALEAARRTLARRGAKKISSGRMPVIFDPSMARTFFGAILSAVNGDAVARKASFLAGHLGEGVFRPGISLVDEPLIPGALGSHPFDGEAQRVSKTTLIDADGVLRSYLLDARSAARLAMKPTGHASRGAMSTPHPSSSNVLVHGGQGSLESIIGETERGLLVTHLLGHSPDLITGEYSRGAAGFLVERGTIVSPVEEVTIAGDMREMMRGLDRVGADLDRRGSLMAPSIRFADMMVSGS
jgi:PmbA protein